MMKSVLSILILLTITLNQCLVICNAVEVPKVDLDAVYDTIWDPVTDYLNLAIENGTFPGCVALVGNQKGVLYASALGKFTYGDPTPINAPEVPQMNLTTLFDMASCSKVTATTSAIAQFYQRGELNLDSTVASIIGEGFSVNGKGPITVRNCLLHNSGFFPDPNPFWNTPEFGCPATSDYYPPMEFSCQAQIYQSILNQSLENPIGSTYVYSDLNFMTLMFVVGQLASQYQYVDQSDLLSSCTEFSSGASINQCYYEAYVRKYVFGEIPVENTGYLPPLVDAGLCAPTENDTVYMHTTIQGVVSDGNAYAMGGVGGHAGVFSNAIDMWTFMYTLMFAEETSSFLNSTTVKYFTTEYNHTQSSRALGWNTNDPDAFDYGWDLSCGTLSPKTWMHLGYTGTMLCGDPERELIVILLTNRVYPDPSNVKIDSVRRPFSTLVQKVFDSYYPSSASIA